MAAYAVDFLREFNGTVVITPVAASNAKLRDSFRPDIVIVDDAATMREITTLIPIAFFDPKAWIITGDVAQKPPHISGKCNPQVQTHWPRQR